MFNKHVLIERMTDRALSPNLGCFGPGRGLRFKGGGLEALKPEAAPPYSASAPKHCRPRVQMEVWQLKVLRGHRRKAPGTRRGRHKAHERVLTYH